jgi:DNA-binding transcriptional regulator YhcF (GntR family)
MSHFGVAIEYGLHVLLRLVGLQGQTPPSVKALAKFQGIPPAYLAKIMTQLEKAGLVVASEGTSAVTTTDWTVDAAQTHEVKEGTQGCSQNSRFSS